MKKLFLLLSLSTAAMAAAPSTSSAKLVLDLPPILAGKTPSTNTCTDDASCAGSTYGQYCCGSKCQQTECPVPNTCTDDASCAGSTYGQYCCGSKCQQTECSVVPTTGLNDTGITSRVGTSGQEDADFGRDKIVPDPSDGHAGFSFTKINDFCVLDNVTGLAWEVKTAANKDATVSFSLAQQSAAAFTGCGASYSQCRLPTIKELLSIVSWGSTGYIDLSYFPNTASRSYWSQTTSSSDNTRIWGVRFADPGHTNRMMIKTEPYHFRAVCTN